MKTGFSIKKFFVYILLISIVLFGFNIAAVVMNRYSVVVNGLLGIVLLLLAYLLFLSPVRKRIDEGTDALFEFPRNTLYFILTFVVALVCDWTFRNIIDMILYLNDLLQ